MRRSNLDRVILCDSDEVLSDCVNPILDIVHDITGIRYKKEDLTNWDVLESIGRKDLQEQVSARCSVPGFCEGFQLLPGAQEGIRRLSELGTVVIVTSPMSVPNWAYERTRWLQKHFGIPRTRVIHTTGKEFVSGCCLIDDKADNLFRWKARNPHGKAFLWEAPYNRFVQSSGLVKVSKWDEVIDVLSRM